MFLLPSRGRPDKLKRFIDAWHATGATAIVVLLLDDDDVPKYAAIEMPKSWITITAPRIPIAHRLQWAFDYTPGERYYGFLADDLLPRTEGWDQKLIEAAGDDGVAFGKDSIYNGSFASHPVVAGELVRRVGWLSLVGLQHLYVDAVWTEIGRQLGTLRYLPDVVVEHLHFSNQKAELDKTYNDHFKYSDGDKRVFEAWKKEYRCAS